MFFNILGVLPCLNRNVNSTINIIGNLHIKEEVILIDEDENEIDRTASQNFDSSNVGETSTLSGLFS